MLNSHIRQYICKNTKKIFRKVILWMDFVGRANLI